MKTKNEISLTDIEDYVRLIEVQRDLCYHLENFKESCEQKNKELEIITQKAQKVVNLRQRFRTIGREKWLTLSEEDVKKLNNILQARHIKI